MYASIWSYGVLCLLPGVLGGRELMSSRKREAVRKDRQAKQSMVYPSPTLFIGNIGHLLLVIPFVA